ncbi:MAG: chemotaxis protein CheX [Defluviitaleaceae bacterium]|nr:chemotaxis protein CheX [Defluviitaleaceae bacterium]
MSVSIVGAFSGEVVFNMKEEAGCFIVSRMMMGQPVHSMQDDMNRSAVSELANIISGNVATIFAVKDIAVDIRPPIYREKAVDADFPILQKISKVVCVPLQFQNGHIFELDVMIP